jgi:hypothetical protein
MDVLCNKLQNVSLEQDEAELVALEECIVEIHDIIYAGYVGYEIITDKNRSLYILIHQDIYTRHTCGYGFKSDFYKTPQNLVGKRVDGAMFKIQDVESCPQVTLGIVVDNQQAEFFVYNDTPVIGKRRVFGSDGRDEEISGYF